MHVFRKRADDFRTISVKLAAVEPRKWLHRYWESAREWEATGMYGVNFMDDIEPVELKPLILCTNLKASC